MEPLDPGGTHRVLNATPFDPKRKKLKSSFGERKTHPQKKLTFSRFLPPRRSATVVDRFGRIPRHRVGISADDGRLVTATIVTMLRLGSSPIGAANFGRAHVRSSIGPRASESRAPAPGSAPNNSAPGSAHGSAPNNSNSAPGSAPNNSNSAPGSAPNNSASASASASASCSRHLLLLLWALGFGLWVFFSFFWGGEHNFISHPRPLPRRATSPIALSFGPQAPQRPLPQK
jgi:hypothetical protein